MKKYIAEAIGTFALVLCGTGAIVINELSNGGVTHAGISLTFGLIVLAMICAFGDISGAHLNPAISIGFAVAGKLPLKEAIRYISAQVIGAFAASFSIKGLFPGNRHLGATLPAGSAMQSFILEIILTSLLMFVVMSVSRGSKEKGITAAIAVAAVVGLEAWFAGNISGASMNPARSLAPAIVSGSLQALWVYLTAPVIGAVTAVTAYNLIKSKK